ncbi:MAG TPA: acyltransferase family protein [Baekduia sp.]|nr:acyltransferase family protein [Baekduia sp.]
MTAATDEVRKPPPGHRRFPLLDGVRAIAALSVVGVHISDASGFSEREIIGQLGGRLNVGVTIFFVLSGFLLYRPFLAARVLGRPAPRTRRYFRRRALRIIPAYWVALTLLWLVGWITFSGGAIGHYLFFDNLSSDAIVGSSGIAATWSLTVEVAFYIALPLIVAVTGKLSGRRLRTEIALLTLLAVASLIGRLIAVLDDPGSPWSIQLPTMFAWFAGGMVLAALSVAEERDGSTPGFIRAAAARPVLVWTAAIAVYAFCALGLDLPIGIEYSKVSDQPRIVKTAVGLFMRSLGEAIAIVLAVGFLSLGLRAGAVVALAAQNVAQHVLFMVVAVLVTFPAVFGTTGRAPTRTDGVVGAALGNRVVSWLGLISYGVFLWHQSFINELVYAHGWFIRVHFLPTVWLTLATLAFAITVGAASYYLVERPFLRLKER